MLSFLDVLKLASIRQISSASKEIIFASYLLSKVKMRFCCENLNLELKRIRKFSLDDLTLGILLHILNLFYFFP